MFYKKNVKKHKKRSQNFFLTSKILIQIIIILIFRFEDSIRIFQSRYIQVADNLASEATRERELAPLLAIKDAYPKMVVVREGAYANDADGIRIVHARDFFLG